MYMKLLEDTIRELKGEELEDERRATVNLRLDLRIDETYIPDMNQRLAVYRRLASARTLDEVGAQLDELRDRYGAPPASVLNLAEYARIRLAADRIGLESLDREGSAVVLKFRQDAKLDPTWLLRLVQARGDLTLLPPAILRLDLSRPVAPAAPPGRGPEAAKPRGAAGESGRLADSWWTVRATAGEVTSRVYPGGNDGRGAARPGRRGRAIRTAGSGARPLEPGAGCLAGGGLEASAGRPNRGKILTC